MIAFDGRKRGKDETRTRKAAHPMDWLERVGRESCPCLVCNKQFIAIYRTEGRDIESAADRGCASGPQLVVCTACRLEWPHSIGCPMLTDVQAEMAIAIGSVRMAKSLWRPA